MKTNFDNFVWPKCEKKFSDLYINYDLRQVITILIDSKNTEFFSALDGKLRLKNNFKNQSLEVYKKTVVDIFNYNIEFLINSYFIFIMELKLNTFLDDFSSTANKVLNISRDHQMNIWLPQYKHDIQQEFIKKMNDYNLNIHRIDNGDRLKRLKFFQTLLKYEIKKNDTIKKSIMPGWVKKYRSDLSAEFHIILNDLCVASRAKLCVNDTEEILIKIFSEKSTADLFSFLRNSSKRYPDIETVMQSMRRSLREYSKKNIYKNKSGEKWISTNPLIASKLLKRRTPTR